MFKELVERSTQIPNAEKLDILELQTETVKTFDGLVDFLRDPKEFPNQEINKLVTLMWRSIGNKFIPVAIDTKGSLSTFSFLATVQDGKDSGMFILPRTFVDRVREDIVMQTGAVVYMGSQARDFYTGHIRDSKTDIQARALAFEADTLLTLQNMAKMEHQPMQLNQYQQQVLAQFPQGLRSLDERLNYPTPTHIEGLRF